MPEAMLDSTILDIAEDYRIPSDNILLAHFPEDILDSFMTFVVGVHPEKRSLNAHIVEETIPDDFGVQAATKQRFFKGRRRSDEGGERGSAGPQADEAQLAEESEGGLSASEAPPV